MLVRNPFPPGPTTWTGLLLHPTAPLLANGLHCSGPFAVPMPSCPSPFRPHVHTVPSLRRATLWELPPATAATRSSWPFPSGPRTGVGVNAHGVMSGLGIGWTPALFSAGLGAALAGRCCGPVLVPRPSCPQALPPHAHTRPLWATARLWVAPPPSAVTLFSNPLPPGPTTGAGTEFPWPNFPFPSSPSPFPPHDRTVRSACRANVWDSPATIDRSRPSWPEPPGPTTGTGVNRRQFSSVLKLQSVPSPISW